MIKALFVSLLIGFLFFMVYKTDLLAFFSSTVMIYGSFVLMVIMLIVARIILGNPLDKDKKDDKSDS